MRLQSLFWHPVGYNRAMQIDEPRHPLTPYDLAGGEPAVRKLVDRFYELMDEDPDFLRYSKIASAHAGRFA